MGFPGGGLGILLSLVFVYLVKPAGVLAIMLMVVGKWKTCRWPALWCLGYPFVFLVLQRVAIVAMVVTDNVVGELIPAIDTHMVIYVVVLTAMLFVIGKYILKWNARDALVGSVGLMLLDWAANRMWGDLISLLPV